MKKRIGQNGFHLAIIPLIIVIIAIVGFAGWYVWDSNKTLENDSGGVPAITNPTPSVTSIPSSKAMTSLTVSPYGWGKISFQAPEGWEKLDEDGTQIFKTIDGVHYQIMFDVQSEDQLKRSSDAMSSDNFESKVATNNGTDIYVIKFNKDELLGLSSCMPSLNKGCAFKQGDNYLLIYASVAGYEGPESIDFTKASADALIIDMHDIASSLPF